MPGPLLALGLGAAGKGLFDKRKADQEAELQALLKKEKEEIDAQMVMKMGKELISLGRPTPENLQKVFEGHPDVTESQFVKFVETMKPFYEMVGKKQLSPEEKLATEIKAIKAKREVTDPLDVAKSGDIKREGAEIDLQSDIDKLGDPELRKLTARRDVEKENLKTAASLDRFKQKILKIDKIGAEQGWTPEQIQQKKGILIKEDPFAKSIAALLGLTDSTVGNTETDKVVPGSLKTTPGSTPPQPKTQESIRELFRSGKITREEAVKQIKALK